MLLALTVPAWVTLAATNSITPPLLTMVDAEIRPVFLITEPISWLADPAATTIRPPETSITRLFSIKAPYTALSTLTEISLSPRKSKVICSPEARATALLGPFWANK